MSSIVIPPDIALREAVHRKMQALAERAPRSIAAHAALLHKTNLGLPIIPARHHLEWCRIMEDIQDHRWVVVVAPPGYAKSTWFSMVYPAWRIGVTGGRVRIGLVSNTASLTWGFSAAIQRIIADPLYQQIYPGVEPDYQRGWSQAQFWTKGSVDPANPTVLASGIGGSIQGKRFDEILLDDPTTWEEARSDTTMESQRLWLKALLLKRFPPGYGPPDGEGRMVVVLTRWGERDLVMTFEELGFKIVTMPALGYWDRELDDEGNVVAWGEEPLWPEVESKAELERQREEDEITFELVKQGNPKAVGGDLFDLDMLQRAPMPDRESFDHVIQYVDTAGGKDRRKGDFFVMGTVGVRKNGEEVWILNMERHRLAAPEQERTVVREAQRWQPNLLCIEDANEGIALYQRLIVSHRLPLKAIKPIRDKEFRAIALANMYRAGRVFHPLAPDGSIPRWVRTYEAELAAFPRGAHDDQVDAACGAYNESGAAGPRLRVLSKSAPIRRLRFA